MDDLSGLFADVADVLGIGAVSIVERDCYYGSQIRLKKTTDLYSRVGGDVSVIDIYIGTAFLAIFKVSIS